MRIGMKTERSTRELGRFLVGGTSAVVTDFLMYRLLLACSVEVGLAKLLGFILGSVTGFLINKYWTFESKGALPREILKYALLYACSCALNVSVNQATLAGGASIWLAFLFATGASTIMNFLGQKFFVFRG